MDVSTRPIVERIARVLAGQRISANAEGSEESAGAHVDAAWRWGRREEDRAGNASGFARARAATLFEAAALRDCVVLFFNLRTRRPEVMFWPREAARWADVCVEEMRFAYVFVAFEDED